MPGWEDSEHIFACQNRFYNFALPSAEFGIAEVGVERGEEFVWRGRGIGGLLHLGGLFYGDSLIFWE